MIIEIMTKVVMPPDDQMISWKCYFSRNVEAWAVVPERAQCRSDSQPTSDYLISSQQSSLRCFILSSSWYISNEIMRESVNFGVVSFGNIV